MTTTWVLLALLQEPAPKEPPKDPFVVKVCDTLRSRIAAQVSLASGSKVKLEEATAKAAKLDEVVIEEAAKKLNATPDAIREAWKQRERKPRKPTYGDGSWIVLGGQDGGLDSDVKGTPTGGSDNLLPPGPTILTRRKPPPPPEPVALGKPLKSKDEWWTTASSSERATFVEAEFARKSSLVEKKEESKKCSGCSGKGAVNVNRGGIGLSVVCSRCHGSKEDLIVQYE